MSLIRNCFISLCSEKFDMRSIELSLNNSNTLSLNWVIVVYLLQLYVCIFMLII